MSELAGRRIKIKVDSVWVMFWYNRTYMVVIGKRVQTNEKPNLWLTNANRNFNETIMYHKVSSNITNTTTYQKLTSDNGKRRIFLKW